jgi:hypothetical protein
MEMEMNLEIELQLRNENGFLCVIPVSQELMADPKMLGEYVAEVYRRLAQPFTF